jgi:hypothetical protein
LGDNEPARAFANIAQQITDMLGESAQALPEITFA